MSESHPPDLLALLEAAKASPDDTSPRHVIADWLDDHGLHDRAECVRLSLRLAAREAAVPRWRDPQCQAWRDELDDPRRETGKWLAPLREKFPQAEFHAGLLRVSLDFGELLAVTPDDIPPEHLPWLETLQLTDYMDTDEFAAVVAGGRLRPFASLDLSEMLLEDDEIPILLQGEGATHLAHVAQLNLHDGMVSDEGVAHLLAAEARLPVLRRLNLGRNSLASADALALVRSPLLGRLTSLELGHNALDKAVLLALAASPHARQLVHLGLRGDDGVGAEAVRALVASDNLPALRSLDLHLGKGGLSALAEWPAGRPLERLQLEIAHSAGFAGLGRSELFRSLADLGLENAPIDAAPLAKFLAGMNAPNLRRLSLAGNSIGDAGAAALAACPALAGLRELDLSRTGVGPEGAAELARSPHLRGLEALDLGDNNLGARGVAALVRSTSGGRKQGGTADVFPNLRALGLAGTSPRQRGLEALAASPVMGRLELLELQNSKLGAEGAAILAAAGVGRLRYLGLLGCGLGDEGAAALAGARDLGQLLTLDLRNNAIADKGARALARSAGLGGLTALVLSGNRITAKAFAVLLAWKPGEWARFQADGNTLGHDRATQLARKGVRYV